MEDVFLCSNKKPSLSKPARIPVISNDSTPIDELDTISCTTDWNRGKPVPVISNILITKFLARVHAFTVVGPGAQASAFSYGPDGIINCLALLPQVNQVSFVSSRDDGPTEFECHPKILWNEPTWWVWTVLHSLLDSDSSKVFCFYIINKRLPVA